MSDTPITPVRLRKLVKSTVLDRGGYIIGGMGLISLVLSPTAYLFLAREVDQSAAFLIGGLLLLFGGLCFYGGRATRRQSQRMLDEFVASHDCECDLCRFVKRTPNTSWATRDSK